MKTIKIGVISPSIQRKRTLQVAKGELKWSDDEPKIWFSSVKSCLEILCQKNIELIQIIANNKPSSISALADMSGRSQGNLSRTLDRLASYKFVSLVKEKNNIRPEAELIDFEIIIKPEYLVESIYEPVNEAVA
jgi:predicted transcriptional regulator